MDGAARPAGVHGARRAAGGGGSGLVWGLAGAHTVPGKHVEASAPTTRGGLNITPSSPSAPSPTSPKTHEEFKKVSHSSLSSVAYPGGECTQA